MVSAILFLLPALALIVPLLLRRYPGERLLVELSRRRYERRPRPRSSVAIVRPSPVLAVRGGLLLARSLAVRPPPLASSAITH
jgi:hypothetical protein